MQVKSYFLSPEWKVVVGKGLAVIPVNGSICLHKNTGQWQGKYGLATHAKTSSSTVSSEHALLDVLLWLWDVHYQSTGEEFAKSTSEKIKNAISILTA